jgi:hypothetical protein
MTPSAAFAAASMDGAAPSGVRFVVVLFFRPFVAVVPSPGVSSIIRTFMDFVKRYLRASAKKILGPPSRRKCIGPAYRGDA